MGISHIKRLWVWDFLRKASDTEVRMYQTREVVRWESYLHEILNLAHLLGNLEVFVVVFFHL